MLYKMTKPGMESVILLQTATASRSFEFARSVVTSRRYANRIFSLAALFGPPTMDIRILTLLVLISVAGSLADLRSPFVRTRRDNPFDPTNFSGGFGFDNIQKQMEENFRQLQAHLQKQQQAIFDTANRIGTDGSFGAGGGHSAVSSINLGPDGGYQAGAINPVAPGVVSRFGEELPPPSGNSYGVFAGSSSHTVIGPDGKPVSHKVSTTGVNDNGKITFRTVED